MATIVEADGMAAGLAGAAILGAAPWAVDMLCTDTCKVMGTGLSLAMALLASAGLSTTQTDGTDHATGPGRGMALRQLVQRRANAAGRRAG